MRFEIELCHIDTDRVIVKVSAWDKDISLGSTLSQALTVEEAEKLAIKNLTNRLNDNVNKSDNNGRIINSTDDINRNTNPSNSENNHSIELPLVPEDWSQELSDIDTEIKRLDWDKEYENRYLTKLYGYTNRNKITSYNELKVFLNKLKSKQKGFNPDDEVINNQDIINNTNTLLNQLSWDAYQGREFLKENFGNNSRLELDTKQLLIFEMLLEEKVASTNNLIK